MHALSGNLTQKAYLHIHDQLTSGSLTPGSRLSNRAVAKQIGISFTPVREALNRLVSEGLLEYRQGLGVFVPVSTRQEIQEIYELREILECAVVAKVCGHLPDEVLAEMAAHLETMGRLADQMPELTPPVQDAGLAEQWRLADSAFHLTLLRTAGNRRVLDTVKELRTMSRISLGGLDSSSPIVTHRFGAEPSDNVSRTVTEHRRIFDALRRGDAEEARAVMAEHIQNGLRLALAAHDRIYMEGSRGPM